MTVTFEELQKANNSIITTQISKTNKKTGETVTKDYAEVNQRIKAFRMLWPEGKIETEMIHNADGVCIFRAHVYGVREDGSHILLGTGTAYEKESSSFINQTSYIENCETSAVGRALGMAGIGIDTSIASYEEVKNAMANADNSSKAKKPENVSRDGEPLITDKQLVFLKKRYKGENLAKLLEVNHIEKLEDMTKAKATELVNKILAKGKENA